MNAQNCHCNDEYQGRPSAWVGHLGCPDSVPTKDQIAWRSALARLASPVIRLHHLRNLREQVFHDALGDRDGCSDVEAADEDA